MKRAGNLFESICSLENLKLAFWKAQRRKRGVPEVEEFRNNLNSELSAMRRQLLAGSLALGNYHYFTIHDPKERLICAASFRERVLHHAIVNVCDPVFDRRQIFDSYACRAGKGVHACLDQAKKSTRKFQWFLKLDVRKYFDSVDHRVLKAMLCRRFKDRRLLSLLDRLIETYETGPGRGIPIGNLTSQYFANDYLCDMDHLIKEKMRIPGYVRYMDDFILWHDDKTYLKKSHARLVDYCRNNLQLDLKPPCLNRTARGVPMLGYRVFPTDIRLSPRSRKRFAAKMAWYERQLAEGEWTQPDYAAHVLPLIAYTNHANAKGFRRKVLNNLGCVPQAPTA